MRLLIAGGLGYIGSAVCEQLRGSRHQVTVVDTRFVPERVAGLPANFRFRQADIGDPTLLRRELPEHDALLFLAAETQAEQSIHKEALVWETNFELPRRVAERCGTGLRFIFASTGNVFGGLDPGEPFQGLTEEDEPRPKYPYAEAKRATERFLLGRGEGATILRFGTNYGWAPGVRFNLVTNLFALRVLLGQDLALHGGGENWRPTCCVQDCARALLFVAGLGGADGEIFHVVRESLRIRDLAARLVALGEQGSRLTHLDKEVPFSSYALSSAKLERMGFRFRWDLESGSRDLMSRLAVMAPPLVPCPS